MRTSSTWENSHRTAKADGPPVFKPRNGRQRNAWSFTSQGHGVLLHHTDIFRCPVVSYDAWRGCKIKQNKQEMERKVAHLYQTPDPTQFTVNNMTSMVWSTVSKICNHINDSNHHSNSSLVWHLWSTCYFFPTNSNKWLGYCYSNGGEWFSTSHSS